MWHEITIAAAENVPSQPDTGSTPVGIITGLLVALTAFVGAVTGLVATIRKKPKRPPTPIPNTVVDPLNSDSIDADAHLSDDQKRIKALTLFLIRAKFDPDQIHDGKESIISVRL